MNRCEVAYLLISGQASVLYGAAAFSEDFDLWIAPGPSNVRKFRDAMVRLAAVVHRLTPPFSPKWMAAGHGFHFRLPCPDTTELYLDVMFRPPRVRDFGRAFRRAARMPSPWGEVPTCSVDDLIRLKRTRRAADYDVISNLVAGRVAAAEPAGRAMVRWAARSTFRAEDLVRFSARLGTKTSETVARRETLERMRVYMERDSRYWSRRIAQLKTLRRRGGLLPEGASVEALPPEVWRGAVPPPP